VLLSGRYALGFGDKTRPRNSPGVNALLDGAVSDNNAFVGTRYFALSHDIPRNQYNLWFFQWAVRSLPASCRITLSLACIC